MGKKYSGIISTLKERIFWIERNCQVLDILKASRLALTCHCEISEYAAAEH